MTVALAVKVNDGIVLASDSATTIGAPDAATGSYRVLNIYNHGTKIFRLHKDLPLGAITWGLGNVGSASLKILAKDFRQELMDGTTSFNPANYTVEEVANLFKQFMYDRHYEPTFRDPQHRPVMGFKIAGYASKKSSGEVWNLLFGEAGVQGPILEISENTAGIAVEGTPQPVRRLMLGFDPEEFVPVLSEVGLSPDQVQAVITCARSRLTRHLVHPSMPIQDAIDLAIFLEHTTAQFTRFRAGPDTVGGPLEVAALTKYEGFKWIHRKHYYDRNLNA